MAGNFGLVKLKIEKKIIKGEKELFFKESIFHST